jgi:hypothetical protein
MLTQIKARAERQRVQEAIARQLALATERTKVARARARLILSLIGERGSAGRAVADQRVTPGPSYTDTPFSAAPACPLLTLVTSAGARPGAQGLADQVNE